jgi:two-component system response regulator RegA
MAEERPTDRVLIVEDEQRLAEVLVRSVEQLGYRAIVAGSGEQALHCMEQDPLPVAILDLNLPGMSGMQLFERLRKAWPDTQVIILTGFGELDTARQAIRLDVVDFLTKPCHLGDLEVALSRARQRLMRDLPEVDQTLLQAASSDTLAPDHPAKLADIERQTILAALARHDGNRDETARELGISIRTLYYRLKQYQGTT